MMDRACARIATDSFADFVRVIESSGQGWIAPRSLNVSCDGTNDLYLGVQTLWKVRTSQPVNRWLPTGSIHVGFVVDKVALGQVFP
jgi:hypothetical protein